MKLFLAFALIFITANPVSAEPTHPVCIAWETDTYTGTYFVHHKTYDTIGPLPALVIKKCDQYREARG